MLLRVLVITCLAAIGFATAQENPVGVAIRAFIVNDDGNLIEATTAEGGDLIEYQVTATNNGETTLPPETVSVNGPVPQNSSYVSGSATTDGDMRLEFADVDQDFSTTEPEGIAAVRWTLLEAFEPGESTEVSYRVTIDGASPSASGDAAGFTQAMFGHLGVIEIECPQALLDNAGPQVQVTCGSVSRSFDLFQQSWDLYADYESEVPVVPEPTTAWKLSGDIYSRDYTLGDLPYLIRYSTVDDSRGLVTAIHSR